MSDEFEMNFTDVIRKAEVDFLYVPTSPNSDVSMFGVVSDKATQFMREEIGNDEVYKGAEIFTDVVEDEKTLVGAIKDEGFLMVTVPAEMSVPGHKKVNLKDIKLTRGHIPLSAEAKLKAIIAQEKANASN